MRDDPLDRNIFIRPRIKPSKLTKKPILKEIILYVAADKNNKVNLNVETLTFTLLINET